MFLYIYGLVFNVSFLESSWFGACLSNSVFILAKKKLKPNFAEIISRDKVLSQRISFKSFFKFIVIEKPVISFKNIVVVN